jgi:hypothetical protein
MFCDSIGASAGATLSGWSNETAYGRDAVDVSIMWPSSESCIITGADRSAGPPLVPASFMTKSRSWKAIDPSEMVLSLRASPAVSDTEDGYEADLLGGGQVQVVRGIDIVGEHWPLEDRSLVRPLVDVQ